MGILEKNSIWSLTLCLNLLKIFGFLVPERFMGSRKIFLMAYCCFWYIFVNGIYTIVQAGDLLQIWGDLSLMVSTSFLLFTNIALGMKIINVIWRNEAIQAIIDEGDDELTTESRAEGIEIIKNCNRETSQHLYLYVFLSGVTVLGWGASAEKNSLPLRAWYPYDTSKSPAYEITYFHQITALCFGASINVSLDTLVTSLIAVCRCRLRLLDLSLRNLCAGIPLRENECALLTDDQDKVVISRLNSSVRRHQAILRTASEIQRCFSEPILAQFTVSMVIICVTAYQLAVELHSTPKNVVRIVAMTAYLICMILQVFLYCHQGNQLSIQSSELATAAYTCPWFLCSFRFRRALLAVMIRSKRDARLTAGGLTTLSLACFTSFLSTPHFYFHIVALTMYLEIANIVKASYTFFTVLQQVEDRGK